MWSGTFQPVSVMSGGTKRPRASKLTHEAVYRNGTVYTVYDLKKDLQSAWDAAQRRRITAGKMYCPHGHRMTYVENRATATGVYFRHMPRCPTTDVNSDSDLLDPDLLGEFLPSTEDCTSNTSHIPAQGLLLNHDYVSYPVHMTGWRACKKHTHTFLELSGPLVVKLEVRERNSRTGHIIVSDVAYRRTAESDVFFRIEVCATHKANRGTRSGIPFAEVFSDHIMERLSGPKVFFLGVCVCV